MGVNLNWSKIYGLRCSERPFECLVNSKNVATDKWPFYDHVWPFFAKYMVIFHKTEIQTVILRCLTSLNLNWFQRYDEKHKKSKNENLHFFMYVIGTANENIWILCHNFWNNQNLHPLSISKWPSEPQFCERYIHLQRNCRKWS